MSDLAKKIIAAAAKRVRPGTLNIGGERFAVEFRVYPAKELGEIQSKIQAADNTEGYAILAEQVLDPSDHRPLFKGKDLADMPNPDGIAIMKAFVAANLGGEPEKN